MCGHCSVPLLRQCPLSLSDHYFLPCAIPAERATYMANYCHPCDRAAFNSENLRKEAIHKEQHERGDCECEYVFSPEERERRFGTVAQRQRHRHDCRKAAEQLAEREQVANTQVHQSGNFFQQVDQGGNSWPVEQTLPQYRHTGEGTPGHHQQHRYQKNSQPQHNSSYSQETVLTADAHQYHQYSLPSTPHETPSRPTQSYHGTLHQFRPTDRTSHAADGAAVSVQLNGVGQLIPIDPIALQQQQQWQFSTTQRHYQYQLMMQQQLGHGFTWHPIALTAFPQPSQTIHNGSIPVSKQTMSNTQVTTNAEPYMNHSRQVSPRTRLNTVSEAGSYARSLRKNSGGKRGRQGNSSKKYHRGNASASPIWTTDGRTATHRHS